MKQQGKGRKNTLSQKNNLLSKQYIHSRFLFFDTAEVVINFKKEKR